ncbi:MAG: FAD-dependent monooxygenase [bacterium]
MSVEISLALTPEIAAQHDRLVAAAAQQLSMSVDQLIAVRVRRRSIDARRKPIIINLVLEVFTDPAETINKPQFEYPDVSAKPAVYIVGSGPAGLFAALRLIELGFRPIVLERGQDVSTRKRDIALLQQTQELKPESNYCFGEGGAGTFSDGKLYSRSKKRGDNDRALARLHFHGAPEEITYEAHPHIGSDQLPAIVANLRETIQTAGGEVRFGVRVAELLIQNRAICGLKTAAGETIECQDVILATGHSAHDLYDALKRQGVRLEPKAFAMGVRIEHPQALINAIQYHREPGQIPFLPTAAYSLVHQAEGRGVYSFCMCPGGFIVPAATTPETMVVNGMSPARRNTPFANAGLVVEIRLEDIDGGVSPDPLAGLRYQQRLEKLAFRNGGGGQVAPAQRVSDFVFERVPRDLPETSYLPGLAISPLHDWLPRALRTRLQEGIKAFDNKMRGFLTQEAIVVGVESRTSSPVRIPRDPETFQHVEIQGLYPCGEGAGYAGGILSSALDGENSAIALVQRREGERC